MNALATQAAPMSFVLFGQAAISLTNFVTLLALGRWAGQDELGIFALGWSCWFLASSLADSLITTPYTYFKQQREARPELSMISTWGAIILGLGFSIVLTFSWLLEFSAFSKLWPSLPLAITGSLMREIARRHFLATSQIRRLMGLDIFSSLLQLLCIAMLALAQRVTPSNMLWIIGLCTLAPLLPLLSVGRVRRLMQARLGLLPTLLKFFQYGRWLLLGGLCHVLTVQIYPWAAFLVGGTKITGLYAACVSIVNIMAPILTGLTNYFRPRFMLAHVDLPRREFSHFVFTRVGLFLFPGIALCIALVFYGETILARLYGPSFQEGAVAIIWFGGGALAICLAAPFQLGLLALNATVTNLYYHALSLCCIVTGVLFYLDVLNLIDLGRINFIASWIACLLLVGLFLDRINNVPRV